MGRNAASLPFIEAIFFLTSLYPAMLPQHRRSELGAFYTPPCLAERLVELAVEAGLDWRTARVLDPAAGGGAFLIQAASQMRIALAGAEPAFALAQMGKRLCGLELDANAAAMAQASLELLLADWIVASGRPAPLMVKVCDTLEETPRAEFDLVVGNPPYGRVTLNPDQRARFARGLYGHANLYGVFTDIAIRWCKPNGLIAYLTPTSMLGGQYFAALRGLLAKEAPPIGIDLVQARQGVFEDVMQETLLALYRCKAKPQRIQVHYLTVRSETEAAVVRNGTIGLPKDPKSPWFAPRDPKHGRLIAQVERMPTRLSDWGYEVSTGPLVWNRFKGQLQQKAGKNAFPLIWAEAVTSDGRFMFRAEKKNHAPYFRLEHGDGWLLVEEGCVLLQRTTAKEQARRLIAAELPTDFVQRHGGVVVENHLNMVRATEPPKVSAAAVAAILNSRVVDEVFRCISGSVAVSAFELEALPMPSVTEMKAVERMVAHQEKKAVIDAAIAAIYGWETV
jgi:adenine-specific DNA-methyltransferase